MSVGCRFLTCNASRIWSFCLLFWCSNIVVLSVRIFRSCVVGHECFFKCWAIELVSERCIVSLLDRVVEVKPTYILLLSEIQSPKGHLNLYITLFFFVVDPPLMMAQSRAESTRETCNYGQYINQFPQNTIKVIWEFERIQKKICRHKMSIMFNEICIYIYVYIYQMYKDEKALGLQRMILFTEIFDSIKF